MVALTPKQREDLNFAIQEYLMKNKFENSAQAFAQEANVDYEGYIKNSTTNLVMLKDILERKWNSIAKMKKKETDLEK